MISSTIDNQFRTTKLNECILRRRARNLRAKVKALLPVTICCKHTKRNKNIYEIKNSKKIWDSVYKPKCWNICHIANKQNQFYYEKEKYVNRAQRFEKLTPQQVQQIKQDKLYYLGQDNLDDFEHYLIQRHAKQNYWKNQNSGTLLEKNFQAIVKHEHQNKDQNQKLIPIRFENKPQTSPGNKSHRGCKMDSVEWRQIEFAERRKLIDFEEKSRITTNKVKLKMKMEKSESNLKQAKYKSLLNMEYRKEHQTMKLNKVKTKRENIMKKPEIKQLEEELRRTCLGRFVSKKVFSSQEQMQY